MNHSYFIHPDASVNEAVIDLLRQSSLDIVQESLLCADGKKRNLIQVSYDMLMLLKSQKARQIIQYGIFRKIGVDGEIRRITEKNLALPRKGGPKSKAPRKAALKHLSSLPGVMLGSQLPNPSVSGLS